MTNDNYKLVEFDKYCKNCKHKDKKETEEPCDECLFVAAKPNSHKPEKFEPNDKTKNQ